MRDQHPATETMKISEVKQQLNRLVNRVYRHETRIMVEKSGIPVAGIVSAEDLRRLDRLDRERAEHFKNLEEFGEAFKDVPVEELEREVARSVAEVRAERRGRASAGGRRHHVIRAVLDTNVLASGFVEFATAERAPARLLGLWREQRFALVVSAAILTELLDAVADPYFRRQLTPEQIDAAQLLLRQEAISTPLTVRVSSVATHPEDGPILATAVNARAEYLVTGDKKLQQLGSYQGVRVVSPRTFLDLLQAPDDEF